MDWTNQKGVWLHDSGGAWASVPPPSVSASWHLEGLHLISWTNGWAVGWDATNGRAVLLRYSGGMWSPAAPPSMAPAWGLNSVHFSSPSEGWAVGRYEEGQGVLLHFLSPISPNEGTIGTELAITGSGFGTKKSKVLVGSVSLKILQWSDELIRGSVPKALPEGTYDVVIQPYKSSSITLNHAFAVRLPEIESLQPASGSANDVITINGSFFGTKKGKVTLGGKNCRVLNWKMTPTNGESEIQFVVPKGLSPGIYELKVTITGMGSVTVNFTVQ